MFLFWVRKAKVGSKYFATGQRPPFEMLIILGPKILYKILSEKTGNIVEFYAKRSAMYDKTNNRIKSINYRVIRALTDYLFPYTFRVQWVGLLRLARPGIESTSMQFFIENATNIMNLTWTEGLLALFSLAEQLHMRIGDWALVGKGH